MTTAAPGIDIITEYLACWRKSSEFDGRARRREYWGFQIMHGLVTAMLSVLAEAVPRPDAVVSLGSVPLVLYWLAALVPGLSVLVRRLHDTGRRGWHACIAFIPLLGVLVLLWWLFQDSAPEANVFGPNPKAVPDWRSGPMPT